MKKIFLFILLMSVLCFSGCSRQYTTNFSNIETTKNYQLYAYNDNDILSDYYYFITNNNSEKIDSGYLEYLEPKFQYISDNVLKLSIPSGSDVLVSKYYNLDDSAISGDYQNVYYDNDRIVAYINYKDNSAFIIVKEIFNNVFLLQERLDMDGIMTTDFHVNVIDNVVQIQHSKGADYKIITETFEIEK